ncbi:hypothetical protein JTE90_024434 [Oedothorax gibbosus]|uniref:BTB domain-containing protein n=1 Tax=Oedothorax gibbosus TaxID=931172 RepID=A0AAV6UHK4_9ARAC|nr:hypothetical protein JTE90_024434 [Oedothorax gibbosus]
MARRQLSRTMTANQPIIFERNAEEMEDSYLCIQDVTEQRGKKTYVLRWIIREYKELAFGIHYNAHHIRIGKILHRLSLLKFDTKFRTLPENSKLVYVYLGLTPNPAFAKVSLSILRNSEEEMHPLSSTSICIQNLMNRKCYSGFIEPPEFLLRFHNPIVLCRITLHNEVEVSIEKMNSMATDMGKLFLDGMFSDLTINVGFRKFRAHTAILAARSQVFVAMFQSDMKEKTEKTLDIVDSDADVFGDLLWYLYTGKIRKMSVATALSLLLLADKYDIKDLKSEMEDFMRSNLSTSQVLDIFVAAKLCNVESLREEALHFIHCNLREIMRNTEWKTFRNRVDLVDEILEYISMGSQC